MMAIICIDPGHGGTDSGGTGHGRREKDDVLNISLKIKALLEKQGVRVIMTRTTDKDIGIKARCDLANKNKADYFLSVHRDAFGDASANGSGIYIYSRAGKATADKAQAVYDAVISASGFKRRGLKYGAANFTDYGVNTGTNMSAALLELGFITNDGDNRLFDKNMDNIALAITQALCDITGVDYKMPRALGDVDGDGDVDTDDARAVLRASVGLEKLTDEEAKAADIDGNGKITTDDARAILRKSVGLE